MAKKEKNNVAATPAAVETKSEEVKVNETVITEDNVYEKIDEESIASLEAAKLAFEKMAKEKQEKDAVTIKCTIYQSRWINLKAVCGMRKYRAYAKLMKEFATKTQEFAAKVSGDPSKNIAPSMNKDQYDKQASELRKELNQKLEKINSEYNEKINQIKTNFRQLGVWDLNYDFDPSDNCRYGW